MTKNRKRINAIFAVYVVLAGLCYDLSNGNLVIKTLASGAFVLQGLGNVIYGYRRGWGNRSFSLVMLLGLLFGLAADIALELNFMMGAAVFAVGHLLYILAYCRLYPMRISDLLPGLLIFLPAAAAVLFLPIFDFGSGMMQMICVAYAGIISLMFGKSLRNYRNAPSTLTLLLAVGSGMFLFSDLMLLFGAFSNVATVPFNSLCVNTYYPAQSILAWSLLYTE